MHLPCHKDDISMAGPHGFVKIMHMYLRTADIWICWFARFAFVKPSCLHLQTSDILAQISTVFDSWTLQGSIFYALQKHLANEYVNLATINNLGQ